MQKTVGNPVSFDVMVSPGTNKVSYVKLEMDYDPTKLSLTSSPFVVNTNSFPVTQEGPILQSGKIFISLTVGSDPSKAISQTTKVGTINFTATAQTPASAPTSVTFGPATTILSVAATDESSENVLSSSTPGYIQISAAVAAVTPTPVPPTATPIPPTATPIPPTAAPTPVRKAGDGGTAGNGGGCGTSLGSNGGIGGIGSNSTGGTGGTGGTGCSGTGSGNIGGIGGVGGLGSSTGAGNPGANGKPGTGTGGGGGGGAGGGGAPGQPGGKGGDGGTGCNGALGQPGKPGEPAPNSYTGGKGGAGGAGGAGCAVTPTPIPPTAVPTPTPTSIPSATKLNFTVFMHGIGNSGDNVSPNLFSLSNKNPLHKTRSAKVEILNTSNVLVGTFNGNILYDNTSGNFKGIVDLGTNFTGSGSYTVKITSPTHLRKIVPGPIQTITIGQVNTMPNVSLIAGDITGQNLVQDNALNILDYNMLIGCYSDLAPATSCTAANKLLADLNDDGNVNQFDYNLFLREITVQNGQ